MDILNLFLEVSKSKVNYQDIYGETPLFKACLHKQNKLFIENIFKSSSPQEVKSNICNNYNMSPLLCCCSENPENLELLLSHGADPNISTYECIDSSINDEHIQSTKCSDKYKPNLTPLIYCCLHDYEQCIEPLLLNGGDPNVKYGNESCVDIAFSHRHFRIVNKLIQHGCSRFYHNRPLHIIIRRILF